MFPEKQKSYPGRSFVQALQVLLVVAIGVFSVIALTRPRDISDEVANVEPVIVAAPVTVPPVAPDNDTSTLYNRAWTALDQDNYDLAIGLYTQTLELDPTMADAWLGRAVAYAKTGTNEAKSRNDFWRYLKIIDTDRLEREITADQSLTLDMTEGRVYALSFEVQKGDVLNITANSIQTGKPGDEGVVDPLVLLFNTKGDLIQASDDTLNADGSLINMNSHIDEYKVPQAGPYTVLVSHAGGGSEGTVDVTVSTR